MKTKYSRPIEQERLTRSNPSDARRAQQNINLVPEMIKWTLFAATIVLVGILYMGTTACTTCTQTIHYAPHALVFVVGFLWILTVVGKKNADEQTGWLVVFALLVTGGFIYTGFILVLQAIELGDGVSTAVTTQYAGFLVMFILGIALALGMLVVIGALIFYFANFARLQRNSSRARRCRY